MKIMVLTDRTMAASLKASTDGLERVDKARCKQGWNKTEEAWAGLATTSQATLRRFWAGLPIRTETFEKICEAVGITDWEAIVDIEGESKDGEVVVSRKRLSFAIAGSIDETDKQKLDAIVTLLRKMGGDATIEMVDIVEGSLKLILKGSDKGLKKIQRLFNWGSLNRGLQRIQRLFHMGALDNIEGEEILEVKYLATNELADIVRKNGAEALDLQGVDLSNTDLSGAYLSDAYLSDAILILANLSGADLIGVNLYRAYLYRADLSGVNLTSADLIGANLTLANLSEANLSEANLSEANLSDADLRSANLSYADLRSANLRGANLSYADLRSANLRGARFGYNPGLSDEDKEDMQRRGAIFEDSPDSDVPSLVKR